MSSRASESPRSVRRPWVIILCLTACALMGTAASQWRPLHRDVVAQQPAPVEADAGLSLAYVPRDALFVFAARPTAIFAQPAFSRLHQAIEGMPVDDLPGGLRPDDITELTVALLFSDPSKAPDPVIQLRLASPDSARQLTARLGTNPQPIEFGDSVYFRTEPANFFSQLNSQKVIVSPSESALRRCLAAGTAGASTANWAPQWATLSRRDAVAVVNTSLLRGLPQVAEMAAAMLTSTQPRGNRSSGPTPTQMISRLAPLWQKSEYVAASVTVADRLDLRVVSQSATEDDAKEMHGALLTALSILRVSLSAARGAVAGNNEISDPMAIRNIDALDEILERAQVARRDTQVGAALAVDAQATQQVTAALIPAVLAAKATRDRTVSINNLRQIGLAFHNYHDTYKTFPMAVQIGPKNVPHSWRVTLLPFLNQQKLFQEYRQDEPWDSENNQRVLAKMPDVYRCPRDRADSLETSYFVFTGPETIYRENARSASFANILDGTSNTILAVETKRPVPWTKPDEISFDSSQPLPKLASWYPDGFTIVMCDGYVRFVPDITDEQTLKYMIMNADGHPVDLPGRLPGR